MRFILCHVIYSKHIKPSFTDIVCNTASSAGVFSSIHSTTFSCKLNNKSPLLRTTLFITILLLNTRYAFPWVNITIVRYGD